MSDSGVTIQMRDIDRGYKQAVAETVELGGSFALVGILEGATVGEFASEAKPEKAEVLIAEYAAELEYGTNDHREYAWMRGRLDQRQAYYNTMILSGMNAISAGKMTAQQLLNKLAIDLQADFRLSITDLQLIDTGAMRNSIQFKVVMR